MAGKNRIVRTVEAKTLFPSAKAVVDSTVNINQGDLVIFDDTNNLLALASAETDAATFLGIMIETIVDGKVAKPYVTDVDDSSAIMEIPGPQYGVVAKLVLKTSDAINPGDLVYLDPTAGAYHVSSAGTKAVGVYGGPAIASAAAGQEIEVLLGARHPDDSLHL